MGAGEGGRGGTNTLPYISTHILSRKEENDIISRLNDILC